MATRLLNSGDLRNYQAIGEDGVLVWQRADAFRASIENSSILGEHYARCLATPRFSSDGTHVDWFVPFQSNRADGDYEVVSWNAASPDEKARALKKFEELEEKFLNFGYNLEARSLSSNDKLFAHFLTGNNKANIVLPAIHYPDESCIYIVNGEPVITFWGFLNAGSKLTGSPFDGLKPVGNFAPHKTALGATAATTNISGAATTAAATAATTAAVTRSHKWCWLLGLLLLLLLLPLLLYLLWWFFFARGLPLFKVFPDSSLDPKYNLSLPIPDIRGDNFGLSTDGFETKLPDITTDGVVKKGSVDDGVVLDGTGDKTPMVPDENAVPQDDSTTPETTDNNTADDSQKAPDTEENTSPSDNQDGVNPPKLSDKDNVAQATDNNQTVVAPQLHEDGPSISNKDLQSGDIGNFDGTWKVNSPIVDRNTNKPLQLQYDFKDGKGTATITQKNGIKCTGKVTGGLKSGSFNINSQSVAKCTDGSSYEMPTVVCKEGKNGNSECISTYSESKSNTGKKYEFPMNIHR